MHIGLLEDDPAVSQHVRDLLEHAGHNVQSFMTGSAIRRAMATDTFDLFVLDWWVPEENGMQVLQHIRGIQVLNSPVLFLASRSDEEGIVEAFNAGADDYCVKPVQAQVLLARISALLRRTYPEQDVNTPTSYLGYRFSPAEHRVDFDGQTQTLTHKEFKLALYLFENAERAVSRKRLTLELWGGEGDALSRTLDVHVSAIRKKLALSATSPRVRLQPVYGFGYRLVSIA